jgi:hypothetical protein
MVSDNGQLVREVGIRDVGGAVRSTVDTQMPHYSERARLLLAAASMLASSTRTLACPIAVRIEYSDCRVVSHYLGQDEVELELNGQTNAALPPAKWLRQIHRRLLAAL